MHIFYTPELTVEDTSFNLPDEEAHHAVRVLRCREGDTISVTNGKGLLKLATISAANKKGCVISLEEAVTPPLPPANLHIAIAPTKNQDRIEWFTEKCVEIGIKEISFVLCDHAERKRIKVERIEKTAISAMKQSQQAWLPQINDLVPLKTFIQQQHIGEQYIAYQDLTSNKHLKDCLVDKSTKICILIGPEGDFSNEEIAYAKANGFQPVLLGNNRLRTETAGVIACSIVNLINA